MFVLRHDVDDAQRQAPDAQQVGAEPGMVCAEEALLRGRRADFLGFAKGRARLIVARHFHQHQLAHIVKQPADDRVLDLLGVGVLLAGDDSCHESW